MLTRARSSELREPAAAAEEPWTPERIRKSRRLGDDITVATWNMAGFNQLRLDLVDSLGYDVVALPESRGAHRKFECDRLVCCSDVPATDRGGGVLIRLSQRASRAVMARGACGHRIVWVRLKGMLQNLFVLAVYVPYFSKQSPPFQEDVLKELKAAVKSLPAVGDMVIVLGDFNARLARSVDGITGKYCVHHTADSGGRMLTEMMQDCGLFASSTAFKPKRRSKPGPNQFMGNATYVMDKSGLSGQFPAQIDYVLCSRRWSSCVRRCYVRWGPSELLSSTGGKRDHGMVVAFIRQRIKRPVKPKIGLDFHSLSTDGRKRAAFDDAVALAFTPHLGGDVPATVEKVVDLMGSLECSEKSFEVLQSAVSVAMDGWITLSLMRMA